MVNRTKFTPASEAVFLATLGEGWSVEKAAGRAGVSRQTVYGWRANNPDFSAKWDEAWEAGAWSLVDTATERAKDSSDRLLEILLRARLPKLFAPERLLKIEQTVTGNVIHEHNLAALSSPSRMAEMQEILRNEIQFPALPEPIDGTATPLD